MLQIVGHAGRMKPRKGIRKFRIRSGPTSRRQPLEKKSQNNKPRREMQDHGPLAKRNGGF